MPYRVGRYEVHEPIASGGMAVVHLGRIVGPVGFSRTVAIKRLHPHLATDPEFVTMFLDEARLAARVQHPNVVATLDVVASHGQLFLVMDFVLGASLSQLVRSARSRALVPPAPVVSAILAGALYGLHAAHEARDQRGESLRVVHRDVSPQNLLVGIDGVTRVVDFGVAKAAARSQSTGDGQVKGKLAYMAPEQLLRKPVDRRADVYAAGVVLWEAFAMERLFAADAEGAVIAAVLEGRVPKISETRRDLPAAVDVVVARAVCSDPEARFATALDFAAALEAAIPPAPQREVSAWVEAVGGADIDARRMMVSTVERSPSVAGDAGDLAFEGLVAHALSPEEARQLATALTATIPSRADLSDGTLRVPARSRGRAPVLWIGGAFGVAVAGTAAVLAVARPAGPSVAAVSSAPPVPAPSSVAPPAPSSTTVPTPAPSVGPVAELASSPLVSRAPARPMTAAPRAHAASRKAPSAAPASCDPAFTVDGSGVKRFKPWCL